MALRTLPIRHVGNSNVLTIPRDLRKSGYEAGTRVTVESLPGGQLLLTPLSRAHNALLDRVRAAGQESLKENAGALAALADYDNGKRPDLRRPPR